MGKKVSNALPRILTAISFCFVAIAAPLINAINAFAALPEGLVANDDDDFAEVGELDTSEETVNNDWKLNSSNLYSGRVERGDIRIQNLNLANAILEEYESEYDYDNNQATHTLVTNENEKNFSKYAHDDKTSLVYDPHYDDRSARLTFENAAEIIETGELLDLQVVIWGARDTAYIVFEDCPETNYTSLLLGPKSLEGEDSRADGEYDDFQFRVNRHGDDTIYGAPLISSVAIYDLDMPFCPAPGYIYWNQPYAEIVMPYQGVVNRRVFSVSGASLSVVGFGNTSYIGPGEKDISSCDNLSDEVATRSLQAGFIMEANFGETIGLAFDSFGTVSAQKIIDFNLVFPIVNVLAGKGGSVSETQQVVERNFGDPYVLQVTPDNGYNIKNIAIESLDTGATIKDFTLEDFLADSATVPGSVVTLDNGIQFKYKGDGVVNVILPAQYMLGANDVTQPNYDDFIIAVTFEDENGNADDPAVPNTSDAGKVENPNTDDSIYLPVLMLGAAATVLVTYRKRRQI